MKFLALASLLSLVAAQSSSEAATASSSASAASPSSSTSAYGSGLVSALNSAGLTTLAGLLQPLASDLVPIISEGNFTVFAPTNDALASVDTSNMTALAEILMYHIAYGQPNVTANNTIARTLLSGSQVNLGQNYTNQALVYNTNTTTGAVQVVGQNVTVSMNTTYQNLLVNVIDGVLSIPGPIPMELANPLGANATTLVTSLSAVAPDLLTLANTTAGLTVFAPVNSAVQAAAPALLSLSQSNSTAITDIVASHVLPAVVYSTNITDGLTSPTLNNNTLSLAVNSSGVFVSNNGVTAQVLATDFVASNGVIHTIDRILFDTASANSTSASGSASASASATA